MSNNLVYPQQANAFPGQAGKNMIYCTWINDYPTAPRRRLRRLPADSGLLFLSGRISCRSRAICR